MTYVYHCTTCDHCVDIIKPLSQIDAVELCNLGHTMRRTVAWQGQMKPGDISFKPDHYTAFNQTFTNPSQLKDAIKKEKYEKGIDLIEVGNDRSLSKDRKADIDWNEAGHALHQELRKRRG